MDLRRRFDQILKMGSGKEVSQANEFTMVLVFYVDHTPAVLSPAYRAATDNDVVLGADNCEWDKILDASVDSSFFLILLVIVVRVHAEVMEKEFLSDAFFESEAFLESERVGFCDYGNNIYNIGQLLENNDIDWLETSTCQSGDRCMDGETYAWPEGWMKNRQQ